MVKISGSAAKPLNIGLQLAVAASSSMSIEDDYYEKQRADELEYVERRGRALRGVPDFGNEGLDNYLTLQNGRKRKAESF